jgi:hypothetical protein
MADACNTCLDFRRYGDQAARLELAWTLEFDTHALQAAGAEREGDEAVESSWVPFPTLNELARESD